MINKILYFLSYYRFFLAYFLRQIIFKQQSQYILIGYQQISEKQYTHCLKMYERTLNQSTASLVSNTSITSRLVRKRDSNFSLIVRSRSKNKQDQGNSSFQHYLSRQSKLFSVDNEESKTQVLNRQDIKYKTNVEIRNQKMGYGNTSLTINHTLSTINLDKNSLIQRADRYIQPRTSSEINNGQSKQSKKREQNNARTRVPTPVKSKKQLANQSKKSLQKRQNIQITQFQLRIAGLQDALSLQKKLNERKQKKLKQTLLDLQNVKQILSQVQMQNKILQNQKKICEQKISQLQKTVLQSQNSLTLAQNNLNKLRQTIKQNRLAQLQTQYKKLQRQNTIQKQQSQKSNHTISLLSDKLKLATKQIQQLRKYGSIQSFANKQSMKQQYLQKKLQRIKNQQIQYRKLNQNQRQKLLQDRFKQQQKVINELKEQIAAMLVKINCLEFFKSKQIQQIKQNYQSQIKSLRVKYSKIIVQLKTKKGPNQIKTPLTSPHIKKSPPNSPTKPKTKNYDIPCKCFSPSNSSINTIQTQKLITQQNIQQPFNPLTPNYLNTNIYGSNYNNVGNNNININITNNNGQIRIQRNNEHYRTPQGLHYYPYGNGSGYRLSSINCRINSQVNRIEDCFFQLSPE